MKTRYIRHLIVVVSILIALPASAPLSAGQQTYVVRRGDNLYRISKSFNTTPESLKKLNDLKNDKLRIGQILKVTAEPPAESVKTAVTNTVPSSAQPAAGTESQEQTQTQQTQQIQNDRQPLKETRTYTVRKGDTISGIAESFDVGISDLAEANKIKNRNKLKTGQVLIIPVENNAVAEKQTAKAEEAAPAPVKKQSAATTAAARGANQTVLTAPVKGVKPNVRDRLVEAGFNMLGVRYRFGGTSEKTGLDCSALVKNIFGKVGFTLPRSSREQYRQGEKVAKEDLQKGDLVFFSSGGKTPTHVGIYIGGDRFLHAASRAKKVTISDLNKTWYNLRYLGARRIMDLWWEDARGPLNDTPDNGLPVPAPQSAVMPEDAAASVVLKGNTE